MNSFLNWVGGKRLLRKEIVARIPLHTCYVEVFGGAGWALFHKDPSDSEVEVYNDIDNRLVDLYRCVKYHPEEMQREMEYLFISRKIFRDFLEQEGFTDIQRSVRFLYLIKRSFAGKGKTFPACKKGGGHKASWIKLTQYLQEVSMRLDRVTIECKDFKELIPAYDTENTFFYLDPPYYKFRDYKHNFKEEDYSDLLSALSQIQGKFILSLSDHPLMREIFGGFIIDTVTTKYGIPTSPGSRSIPREELLISNFDFNGGVMER